MASQRRPKGTYTRPTPDWFAGDVCCGAAEIQNDPLVPGGNFYRIALFNNDGRSRKYYVFLINLASDFAVFYYGSLHPGAFGNRFADCFNIDPSNGQFTGEIRTLTGGSFNDPPFPPPPADPFVTFPASAASGSVGSNGPLFILPVNYSLVISSNSSVNQIAVAFWFVPLATN